MSNYFLPPQEGPSEPNQSQPQASQQWNPEDIFPPQNPQQPPASYPSPQNQQPPYPVQPGFNVPPQQGQWTPQPAPGQYVPPQFPGGSYGSYPVVTDMNAARQKKSSQLSFDRNFALICIGIGLVLSIIIFPLVGWRAFL